MFSTVSCSDLALAHARAGRMEPWQTCSLIIDWRNGRGTIRHTTAWWAVNNSSPFVPVHHPFTLVFKKNIIINPPSISSPLLNILFWFYWRLRPQLSPVSGCWGHHLAILIFTSSWQLTCRQWRCSRRERCERLHVHWPPGVASNCVGGGESGRVRMSHVVQCLLHFFTEQGPCSWSDGKSLSRG